MLWDHTVNTTSPETFTFTLPHPSKHTTDPLPLGSLVSPSASSIEPGFVVVMPTSGKITYWESISSAATLDLIQQQRHGVEYSIPGMYHGETVIQILNAEAAGFVLSFSTGRLAYLSVRDNQGRPTVSTQYLSTNGQSVSIFGSFKSMLSSSWKGDLAAARAGPSAGPGERSIVTAGVKGKFQAWNLHRGGHNQLEAEGEARELIVDELKQSNSDLIGLDVDAFEVVDFTFAPSPKERSHSEALTYRDENGTELLVLTSMTTQGISHYALVQLFLRPKSIVVAVGAIRHIDAYHTPVSKTAISRPRLYLPNPGVAAFVIFQRAVIITSMANEPDSAEAQLLADSHLARSFEDVVDFRRDAGVEVVGSGMEEPHASHHVEDSRSKRNRSKIPAVVLLVKGGGVIRVAITNPDKFTSKNPPQVTAKSKLEQAVFFSNLEHNILQFTGRSDVQFSAEEVGAAAVALTQEILTSTTPYIPQKVGSIRENMASRAEALRTLIKLLNKVNVKLGRATKWKLLWGAEKIAGAAAAWDKYDSSLANRQELSDDSDDLWKDGLWHLMAVTMHEQHKTMPSAEHGEKDRVRHYFTHDVDKMAIAVCYAHYEIKEFQKQGNVKPKALATLCSEANDIQIETLEAAYKFRLAHCQLYGLDKSEMHDNGELISGLDELPIPWTCESEVAEWTQEQALLSMNFIRDAPDDLYTQPLWNKIRMDLSKLVDLAIMTGKEKQAWFLGQRDPQLRQMGQTARDEWINTTKTKLVTYLAQPDFDLYEETITIAEKHQVFEVLAKLIMDKIWHLEQAIEVFPRSAEAQAMELADVQATIAELQGDLEWTKQKNDDLFRKFEQPWATCEYAYFIEQKCFAELLMETVKRRGYVTETLGKNKAYAKLAWINEIKIEDDYERASEMMIEEGLTRERKVWNKKVELSIGKLALLAIDPAQRMQNQVDVIKNVDQNLDLIRIQEKVFAHVRPATTGTIDNDAAREEAMKVFASPELKKMKALWMVLNEKVVSLLNHQAMSALDIIDLLTLIGAKPASQKYNSELEGLEFYYALKVLQLGGPLDKTQYALAERTIWHRCLLRTDWEEINNTDLKDDAAVEELANSTTLFSTIHACLKDSTSQSLPYTCSDTNKILELFDKPSRLRMPTEAMLSEPSALDSRYDALDEGVRSALESDVHAEDALLIHYIQSSRLMEWFSGTIASAKKALELETRQKEVDTHGVMIESKCQVAAIENIIQARAQEMAKNMMGARTPWNRRNIKREGSGTPMRSVNDLTRRSPNPSAASSFGIGFAGTIQSRRP